jgi:hypothetical protein
MEVTGLPELSAQVPWLPQLAVEEGRGGSRPFDKRTHGYCQWHLLITHEPRTQQNCDPTGSPACNCPGTFSLSHEIMLPVHYLIPVPPPMVWPASSW